MKVSYNWLSEYVDLSGYSAEDLAEKLTRSGIEVDIVERRNQGVSGVVVGHVVECGKHPDADKLNVTKVDAGQGELLQIVCGAPNVAAGQKVPVAMIGAVLPGDFKIKKAKLRGVESQGMICSAKELGMNDKLLPKEIQEGILVLPGGTEVGTDILSVLGLNDSVLELDLTPNRSDCLSMIGTAYEIAAILGRPVKLPAASVTESAGKAADRIGVTIQSEACAHYTARLIENVTIGPSPLWMQNRLMAAGMRPINAVVDITNYVMLEFGQPLHAFDADKLTDGRIEVRQAREGETLVTLDGQERKLEPHMLLITDGVRPVGLAGVMGGANSEVSGSTARILLESAKFSGSSVRRTSRQLGLRSEASLRFEKEVDPEAVIPALNRAASLMAEYAGAKVAAGIVEARKGAAPAPVVIDLPIERINRLLGTSLSGLQVKTVFGHLQFPYEEPQEGTLRVHVPSRRGDISLPVDLIEEVARLYGYDEIPTTPISGLTTPGGLTENQRIRRMIRELLTGAGLHEAVSYSLTHPRQPASMAGLFGRTPPIRLAMPMSEDRSVLRTSLLPQLLEVAAYNRNRNMEQVAVFEIGSVFVTEEAELTRLPDERLALGMLLTGPRHRPGWAQPARPVDFYDMKGLADRLLSGLGIAGASYAPAQAEGFHPGRTAEIWIGEGVERTLLGRIGQIHPVVQEERDLDDTYVCELSVDALCRFAGGDVRYSALPRYPAAERDLAVVVADAVHAADLIAAARDAAGERLETIDVFDVYADERHLGAGKKSVALSLVFRDAERTLTDEEVAGLLQRVVDRLAGDFAAALRK